MYGGGERGRFRVDQRGWKRGEVCDGEGGGYPAGTTMHLIINSLDTRGWMSDRVSSRAVVEKRDREDRIEGVRRGLLQKRRSVENGGAKGEEGE